MYSKEGYIVRIFQKLVAILSPRLMRRALVKSESQPVIEQKTTTQNGDRLTDYECSFIERNTCPDCKGTGFYKGPQGGMCTNIRCANKDCESEFNIAQMFGGDRISDPSPKKKMTEAPRQGKVKIVFVTRADVDPKKASEWYSRGCQDGRNDTLSANIDLDYFGDYMEGWEDGQKAIGKSGNIREE